MSIYADLRRSTPGTPRRIPKVFGTLPTINGYDVIAEDSGRPVAHRETLQSANGFAETLNLAANSGTKALSRALGATDLDR